MRKSQLKTGMVLENRKGELTMVLLGTGNGAIFSGLDTWGPLDSLSEDLRYVVSDSTRAYDYDIIRVYQPKSNMNYLRNGVSLKNNSCDCIWERKEIIKTTINGIPVNVPSDKFYRFIEKYKVTTVDDLFE